MTLSVAEITAHALQLPAGARAELADQLVESLVIEDEGELRKRWTAEAIRRRDEVRSGAEQPIPGEQVLSEARRMTGRS